MDDTRPLTQTLPAFSDGNDVSSGAGQGWLTRNRPNTSTPSHADVQADWPHGRCVPIDSVRLPGLQLLSKRLVTRVYALIQPESRQCLDPERLDGLAQQINQVLEKEGEGEAVAELPVRPIVNRVLTLRFRDAAMGEPADGVFRSGQAAEANGASRSGRVVASEVMPSYTFGRWTRPAGLAAVAPLETGGKTGSAKTAAPSFSLHHVQRHWLASHLQIAGNTDRNRDGHSGRIGLEADNLIRTDHALRFNFNESGSQRIDNESETFAFHYAFPLAGNHFTFDANSYSYQSTVIGDDSKYESSGEGRTFGFSGRRSWLSWGGITLDSVLSLSSYQASYFEKGQWTEDSSRQMSTFTLESLSSHDLIFDVLAKTRFSVSSGLEVLGNDYDIEDSLNQDDQFQKFAMAGSLTRELFSWQWGVSGQYQFTADDLPGSEYMLVAGPSMISGFNGQSLSAAEGGWLRFDANSPGFDMPLMPYLRSDLRLSVLRGWVPYEATQADRYGSASAAELSLQMEGRGIQAGFNVGRMLGASSLATTKPDMPDVSFSLSMGI